MAGALEVERASPSLVSVVVPVKDAAPFVAEQLEALSHQHVDGPWELVVADNGCRDGTIEIIEAWRDRLPRLQIVDASDRPGANHARNVGAGVAAGDLLVFVDADDQVVDGWLAALVTAAADADLVGGPTETDTLNPTWAAGARLVDSDDALPIGMRFLPYVPAGNCAIWRTVFEEVGGWDERFVGGGDEMVLSWNVQLAGHRVAFAPRAVLRYRFRSTVGAQCRQMYRYGAADALLYRDFRAHGAPGADNRAFASEVGWLLVHVPDLALGLERRARWLRKASWRLGRLAGSLRRRVWYP